MLALQAEEGEGSGNPSEPQPPPSTAQPTHEEPIPNIESSSPQKTQSPRQALNKDTELPQTSVPIPNVPNEAVHQERGDSVERAATTATSLEAPRDHGGTSIQTRFERASKLSYDSPLRGGNTPRSDEDSMTLQELTALFTKLSNRILALETDLRQTKKVYGTAYTKLIIKVKKLEKTIKTSQARRRAKIMVSDDDMASKDSSKQGRMIEEIDQDVGVTLVTPTKDSSQEDQPEDQLGVLSVAKVLADATRVHTYSRRRRAVSTGSGGVSTASRIVSTADMIQQVNIIIPSSSATKDKDIVMSDSEDSTVTYTAVSSPFGGLSDIRFPGVDGPPVMPEDPYAYVVAAFQAPPSLDYVTGPGYPHSPDFIPELVYPEFMPQEDEVLPAEEQPLPAIVSPTSYSPGYVPESDPEEDPEEDDDEDPEEDPADYPTDGGDNGDDEVETSNDDEDDDVDIEEDEEEEEEHPAPADSIVVALLAVDQAPSAEETKPFETDESASTPPPHPA
ncbi:hypothetical protein Tco_0780343 [Tanacetum coccineum]